MFADWKRGLMVALFLCLLGSSVVQASAEKYELTVVDAQALAFKHNLDFQIATIDWQGAQAQLTRAQIVGEQEMLMEAEKEWEKAQEIYEEKSAELAELVRTGYQQLLESETSLENAKIAQERAVSQLEMDQNKYKAGLLSSLDIDRAQNSLFDAEHRLERATIDLETRRMKFNLLLGLPLDARIALTESFLFDFVPFTFALDTCYELALKLDKGILAAEENLEKAREAIVVAQSPFTPRAELEKALAQEEKSKITLQQARQNLYFLIREEYYALLNQAHNLEMAERNIKLEKQTLQAEESKYAAGVLSNAQIVAQQEKLASLEEQYSAELSNYALARIKLLQAIGKYEKSGEDDEG